MRDRDTFEGSEEFINLFIAEGHDLVDDAEAKLHYLDRGYDDDVINTIFRVFHSIKSTAASLNFSNIKKVTHEAETLLDIFRKEKINPEVEDMDILYQTCDCLRQLIASVEKQRTDKGFEEDTDIVVNDIKSCIENIHGDMETITVEEEADKGKDDTFFNEHLITSEMAEKYMSESIEIMDDVEEVLLALEKTPENIELINDIFRKVHSFKGNSGFFGFTKLEEEGSDMETFLDTMRKGESMINNNLISFMLGKVDIIRKRLTSIECSKFDERKSDDNKKDEETAEYKPLGKILVEMGEVTEETIESALDRQKRKIGEILVEEGNVNGTAVENALTEQQRLMKGMDYSSLSVRRKEIRVSTEKLDLMFDMVGELITAEAMVSQHPDISSLNNEGLNKSINYLNKITRELQELSMNTRMIPLEATFTKMIRLVRDLARKSDKKVDLTITGQETEMDRNVIEEISDPLVHIIRNAVDHGIETTEGRKSKRKSETGNLFLDARYEGNEIWITIGDDGRGLDRENILAKARERGLVNGGTEELKDTDVWPLIFEPGFSTAEKVTEVSGRGVGMDVVKRNIEKLRGKVGISSYPDEGTEITLKIPLTMAILEGVTVKVGNNIYSLPTIDILEFFKIDESQINRIEDGRETIRIREDILPVIKLYDIFSISEAKEGLTEGIIIVIKSNTKTACLLIDEIIGNQQIVIKSLSSYIGDKRGLSGCSVMGNGDISLILDTGGLIDSCIN